MKRSQRRRSRRPRTNVLWILGGGLLVAAFGWSVWSLRSPRGPDGSGEPISRLRTQDFHSLAFSAVEPETVFFGHHGGLLVSTDGGREWQPTSLQNADAMALAAPAADPQIMYAAGHNVFFKSVDGGLTWRPVETNLPGLDIHAFAADPENSDRVFAYVVGFGLFRSEDRGEDWKLLAPGAAFAGLAVGENPEILYGSAGKNGLLKSADGGVNWSSLSGLPGGGAIAIAYARAADLLYVTTLGEGAGLYVSEDKGENWTSLGLNGTYLAIAVDPHDPQSLIAVDDSGRVYASRDGGTTWGEE